MNQKPSQNTINKIKNSLKGKPRSKVWFELKNLAFLLSSFISLCLAFISIEWLISQAKVFFVFWPFITTSWSGWLWVVIPEFAIFALLFVFLMYIIYKRTDWLGVAWADLIAACLIILMIFTNVVINVDAVDRVPAIKSIHQTFLTLPYRIWLRDQHIIDLEQKQEYYGVLANISGNIISINHGGVVLDFTEDKAENLTLGQRIWVKFDKRSDFRVVSELKTW